MEKNKDVKKQKKNVYKNKEILLLLLKLKLMKQYV